MARSSRFSSRKDSSGRFMSRHFRGLDPDLVGLKAYNAVVVKKWWSWLENNYRPKSSLLLVTPCSNVKPYTKSPTSRKIKGMLQRLNLFSRSTPRVEWVYFSDLLIIVPYDRAEDYPACCYDVPPQLVISRRDIVEKVVSKTRLVVEALVDRGVEQVVVFLPRLHLSIWEEARRRASKWPSQISVKYTLFSIKDLEATIRELVGS